jgi:hypothetical protein
MLLQQSAPLHLLQTGKLAEITLPLPDTSSNFNKGILNQDASNPLSGVQIF